MGSVASTSATPQQRGVQANHVIDNSVPLVELSASRHLLKNSLVSPITCLVACPRSSTLCVGYADGAVQIVKLLRKKVIPKQDPVSSAHCIAAELEKVVIELEPEVGQLDIHIRKLCSQAAEGIHGLHYDDVEHTLYAAAGDRQTLVLQLAPQWWTFPYQPAVLKRENISHDRRHKQAFCPDTFTAQEGFKSINLAPGRPDMYLYDAKAKRDSLICLSHLPQGTVLTYFSAFYLVLTEWRNDSTLVIRLLNIANKSVDETILLSLPKRVHPWGFKLCDGAPSPNGERRQEKHLIYIKGCDQNDVVILDIGADDPVPIATLRKAHGSAIVALTALGERFLTMGADAMIRVWASKDGNCLRKLRLNVSQASFHLNIPYAVTVVDSGAGTDEVVYNDDHGLYYLGPV